MTTVTTPLRERLLDGLAASITEVGYRTTTVADIVRRARTSRRTFYEHFSDKEQAFLEAQRHASQEILDRCAQAYFSAR